MNKPGPKVCDAVPWKAKDCHAFNGGNCFNALTCREQETMDRLTEPPAMTHNDASPHIAEVDALKAELATMREALRKEIDGSAHLATALQYIADWCAKYDEPEDIAKQALHTWYPAGSAALSLPHARAAHEHVQAMERFVKLAIAADEASDAYMHEERAMRFGVTDDTKKRHEQAWQEYDEALAALRGEAGKA